MFTDTFKKKITIQRGFDHENAVHKYTNYVYLYQISDADSLKNKSVLEQAQFWFEKTMRFKTLEYKHLL